MRECVIKEQTCYSVPREYFRRREIRAPPRVSKVYRPWPTLCVNPHVVLVPFFFSLLNIDSTPTHTLTQMPKNLAFVVPAQKGLGTNNSKSLALNGLKALPY